MLPEGATAPRGWPPGFGDGPGEADALLALSCVGLTPRDLHALVWETGSASGCLRAIRGGRLGPVRAESARAHSAPRIREALRDAGARVILPADPAFPEILLDLPDPPAWLYAAGPGDPGREALAVVGARDCSAYGREMAERIGRGVAGAGVAVVSGAARGIDAAAHRGALRAGPTVAVLGSGIDVPYPPSSRGLLERIVRTDAVVSEYPPGTKPSRQRFPARNRLVAALGLATTVVEGDAGSGSLITAEFAMDLGRTVFAVPGNVTSDLAQAPNALLVDGATPVRGPADILECLQGRGGGAVAALGRAASLLPPDAAGLSDDERRVLAAVVGEGCTADDVARRAGVAIAAAVASLGALELRGLVRVAGGRYSPPPAEPPGRDQNLRADQTSSPRSRMSPT